jgi:hypothetical protein
LPSARKRTAGPKPVPTRDDGGKESTKNWWRSSDDELLTGRVREVKDVVKGLRGPPPGDMEVQEAFDDASRDGRYRNLLDMVPSKRAGLSRKGDHLLLPVYKSRTGVKVASVLGLKKERRVRLDRFGWAVWELCDGKRDVGAVGAGLKERFGDGVEPLYPRLSKFLAYLVHLDLIELRDPSSDKKKGSTKSVHSSDVE